MHEYSDIIVERTDFSFIYWASQVHEQWELLVYLSHSRVYFLLLSIILDI